MTSAPARERVERALDDIRAGKMIILVDDEDRENEGDLTMAAELVTPEAINFMARHGRGLICLTLTDDRINQLGLPMMVRENRAPLGTAFTVSIEARHGVTTGISAFDRAHTIKTAIAPDARPEDLISPGHVFPLRARRGGVLVRTGQTEGSVDLARLAGLKPAGVICEIMRDDGQMARMPDLEAFAAEHGLRILTIADLIEYRLGSERMVRRVSSGVMRPALLEGKVELQAHVYAADVEDTEYLALVVGDPAKAQKPVLVRVQSMCPVGDVFASAACDCEWQLRQALRAIADEGCGVFLYVMPAKTSLATAFQEHVLHQTAVHSSLPADASGRLRGFGLGAQTLADLGLRRIRLLSNNPKKIAGLAGFGIEVVERVPIEAAVTREREGWLRERHEREGYLVTLGGSTGGKDKSGSSAETSMGAKIHEGHLVGTGLKIAIVASRFNAFVVDRLVEGALDGLRRTGCDEEAVEIFRSPGSFEIPMIARRLADSGRFDAVICLGAVIRGGTPHFEYVASEAAKGIAQVAMNAPVPVTFGVLTTDTVEQAIERAGTKAGNKGFDAALAALEMVGLYRDMAGGEPAARKSRK